jgi:hypothetical protein
MTAKHTPAKRTLNPMPRVSHVLAATLVATLCASQPAWAATYDLAGDFSSLNGGASPWSYGWNPDDGAGGYSFVPLDVYASDSQAMGWSASTHNVLGTPGIWKNLSDIVRFGVAPGEVSLHPAETQSAHAIGNAAIVRFTVPVTGNYWIYAGFFEGDAGRTQTWVVRQGDFSTATDLGEPISGQATNVQLQAGDTFDFVVGHSVDDFWFDNTPLSVQITSTVPEPTTSALLLAGLLSVGWLASKRRT